VPEPWILLRLGFAAAESGVEPVIVSPLIKQREMVVVGYGVLLQWEMLRDSAWIEIR
jgi:hypothetical protein